MFYPCWGTLMPPKLCEPHIWKGAFLVVFSSTQVMPDCQVHNVIIRTGTCRQSFATGYPIGSAFQVAMALQVLELIDNPTRTTQLTGRLHLEHGFQRD
jgi:hypothetical protein